MHGRLKVKSTEEQKRLQQLEKENRIKYFSDIKNRILLARKENVKNIETLTLLSECLIIVPEWNVFWNYRREILISLELDEELMSKELILTKSCLRENPKAYAVWHHRHWVMNNHPNPDWKTEMELCNIALNEDERNFHCWDYRRFIVEKGKIDHEAEFEYTSKRIYDNISNYSSWHYRCSFLDSKSVENEMKDELDLVNNAIFTDPADQSPWFYLRWLMLYNKKKSFMRELYINKALKEVILIVSEPVTKSFVEKINIEVTIHGQYEDKMILDSNTCGKLSWKSALKDSAMSSVWMLSLDDYTNFSDSLSIVLKCQGSCDFKWNCELPAQNFESLIRTDTDINRILCDSVSEEMSLDVVEQELKTIRELHDLEHENKWVLLTIISMLRILSPIDSKVEILEKLTTLKKIDPMRRQFYEDAASKFQIECELISLYNTHKRDVILPNVGLTMVGHLDWMVLMTQIDLSDNAISELGIHWQYLVCLVRLNLSGNRISSLAPLRGLPSLQHLDVHDNRLTEFESHTEPVLYCPRLVLLNIKGNAVSQLANLTELLTNHRSSRNHSSSISVLYDLYIE